MGHIRLKRLPATRRWHQVVALLTAGASSNQIAQASAKASEAALNHAQADPVLAQSLWLLTQIPLAARSGDFGMAAQSIGLLLPPHANLIDVVASFGDAVEAATSRSAGRTDLGEMARRAASESLLTLAGDELPGLFEATDSDVRRALGRFAAPDQFARLARDFFARLTYRHLDYYLSRTLSNQVGPGLRFAGIAGRQAFDAALDQHCREASRIIEAFAAGWFSKTIFQGGITPAKAKAFVFVALKKISAELRSREASSV
jgi:hypothetical protein